MGRTLTLQTINKTSENFFHTRNIDILELEPLIVVNVRIMEVPNEIYRELANFLFTHQQAN